MIGCDPNRLFACSSPKQLGRYEPTGPSLDFQRISNMMAQVQNALSTSLDRHSESQKYV